MKTKTSRREQLFMREFAVETVGRVLALGRTQAMVMDDRDLFDVLQRLDALLYHEAVHFLKLPKLPVPNPKRRRR